MEPFHRGRPGSQPLPDGGRPVFVGHGQSGSHSRGTRARTPGSYQLCDTITGGVILFMIVFTPWVFGTTQDWAVWTMTGTAFLMGALLAAKKIISKQSGYRPMRWDESEPETDASDLIQLEERRRDWLATGLAVLTGVILAYILISAINARAIYVEAERRFDYRDCIQWLPHSYDRASTFRSFWTYAGLACFFWAARDWVLGKSSSERKRRRHSDERESGNRRSARAVGAAVPSIVPVVPGSSTHFRLPDRLRLLLWAVCINGSVLAFESILQRLSGTNKLLWLVVPTYNFTAESQFGPYAYRANAASYFNLLWPVSLGFWLALRRVARLKLGGRVGSGSYVVLLPGTVLMAACPIISTTRGGAVVSVISIMVMTAILLWATRGEGLWFRLGTCSLFFVIIAFSATLGMKELVERFRTVFTDQMSKRTEIYQNALPMARDFPVLGSGAGTFGTLYQLYRSDPEQDWAAYAHDDWLETRITFGWLGMGIVLTMIAMVVARWRRGPGIAVPWEFVAPIWVAMAGLFVHAKFDFPFQVYSILFLFLLLCAVLFSLTRQEQKA